MDTQTRKTEKDNNLTISTARQEVINDSNSNIISKQIELENEIIVGSTNTQNEETKEDSYVEDSYVVDDEDLEHIESLDHPDYDDQELLFIHHEDNGDSDHMVSSIHTSDDTESENSLNMRDDSNRMLDSPPDIRTPSSPSLNSEDNISIESIPTGDFSNPSNHDESFERDIPVMPAPGETRAQILAPLDFIDDYGGESRIQLTPILTKAIETDDDPPSPTLPSLHAKTLDNNTNINNDYNDDNRINNSNSSRNHLPHIPEILFRHQQNTGLDFRHRQNSSLGGMALNIFHHQLLLPFFQGFSWGIGMHLYRYMRNGFSLRSFWRSLSGGVRGPSSNRLE
ncbi:10967_t:CDS:1 [Funneliformis geosporum]|uniref:10967_t:CDS:1 n=1 Tax=Funneliformis geosporum TaxID=1117311 RepID=A0A9W4SBM4_9GLOM|nr:10967_t:CDS:1 [Funneliformis geosporum]